MIAFAVILFALSLTFLWVCVWLHRGNTALIREEDLEVITDRIGYVKALAKVLGFLPASFFLSGIFALMGENENAMLASVAILVLGFAVTLWLMAKVQKKFGL